MIKGDGPCNRQRMAHRRRAHEDGAWVREAAAAYAAKQALRGPIDGRSHRERANREARR